MQSPTHLLCASWQIHRKFNLKHLTYRPTRSGCCQGVSSTDFLLLIPSSDQSSNASKSLRIGLSLAHFSPGIHSRDLLSGKMSPEEPGSYQPILGCALACLISTTQHPQISRIVFLSRAWGSRAPEAPGHKRRR